jgi:hypothetical protein
MLHHGQLNLRSLEFESGTGRVQPTHNLRQLSHRVQQKGNRTTVLLDQPLRLNEGEQISIEISA